MIERLTPKEFAFFTLEGEEQPEQRLYCHFNPSDVTMTMKSRLHEQPLLNNEADGTGLSYRGKGSDQLKVTLLFDDREQFQRKQGWKTHYSIYKLRSWTETKDEEPKSGETRRGSTTSASGRPPGEEDAPQAPKVKFHWGTADKFVGAISNLQVKYLRVDDNGLPIRAQVTVTIKAWPDAPEGQNPTSGGVSGRRSTVVTDGDSLATIAHRYYQRADLWRGIALENGIEDPGRLTSGMNLLIPTKSRAEALSARDREA